MKRALLNSLKTETRRIKWVQVEITNIMLQSTVQATVTQQSTKEP